jgi:hypothetical protein
MTRPFTPAGHTPVLARRERGRGQTQAARLLVAEDWRAFAAAYGPRTSVAANKSKGRDGFEMHTGSVMRSPPILCMP